MVTKQLLAGEEALPEHRDKAEGTVTASPIVGTLPRYIFGSAACSFDWLAVLERFDRRLQVPKLGGIWIVGEVRMRLTLLPPLRVRYGVVHNSAPLTLSVLGLVFGFYNCD